jgi:hypothetical protein
MDDCVELPAVSVRTEEKIPLQGKMRRFSRFHRAAQASWCGSVEADTGKLNPSVVDRINYRQSRLCSKSAHEAAIVYFQTDQGTAKSEHY